MPATPLRVTVSAQRHAGPGRTKDICLSAALAAALSLQLGFAAPAHAADLHCHAAVKVKNDKSTAIKVLKFGYRTSSDDCKSNDGCNEGLSNKRLAPGEEQPWSKQKLGHVATGNEITAVRVEYRDDTSGQKNPSDPWGKARWSEWTTTTGNCTNNKTYQVVVK